jgi:phosphopantothenoylcysteine decarboxylase/phosphopantothenate--cysteine ligase
MPTRLLVTAGPTREPIDAVRFLSNRSSGRMGIAIASEGAARGWPTCLLLGPGAAEVPVDTEVADGPAPSRPRSTRHARGGAKAAPLTMLRFESTEDLRALLHRHCPSHDILVMAAAVADHRPKLDDPAMLRSKQRRGDGEFVLRLEPTPDLLAELATITRPDQLAVGFALDPRERLLASAQEKLQRKKIRAIVANPLETMDAPGIEGTLLFDDGRILRPEDPGIVAKHRFARWLLDRLEAERAQATGSTIPT